MNTVNVTDTSDSDTKSLKSKLYYSDTDSKFRFLFESFENQTAGTSDRLLIFFLPIYDYSDFKFNQ